MSTAISMHSSARSTRAAASTADALCTRAPGGSVSADATIISAEDVLAIAGAAAAAGGARLRGSANRSAAPGTAAAAIARAADARARQLLVAVAAVVRARRAAARLSAAGAGLPDAQNRGAAPCQRRRGAALHEEGAGATVLRGHDGLALREDCTDAGRVGGAVDNCAGESDVRTAIRVAGERAPRCCRAVPAQSGIVARSPRSQVSR